MSFVDLMGSTEWSDAQIAHRVVAMIRQRFSLDDEQKMARIAIGEQRGVYRPTPEESQMIDDYQLYVLACRAEGEQARQDAALLRQALAYERARERLARPRLIDGLPARTVYDGTGETITDPETGMDRLVTVPREIAAVPPLPPDDPAAIADEAERAEAQAIIDAATRQVLDLVAQRDQWRSSAGG